MNRIDPDRPVRVQGACAVSRHGGLCFAYPLFNLEDIMIMPLTILPRAEDVEGQPILRPLPSAKCRSVGPFVFFANMLQTSYTADHGMTIRPHPQIVLSPSTPTFQRKPT